MALQTKIVEYVSVTTLLLLGIVNPANKFDQFLTHTLFIFFMTSFHFHFLEKAKKTFKNQYFLVYYTAILISTVYVATQKKEITILFLAVAFGTILSFLVRFISIRKKLLIGLLFVFAASAASNCQEVLKQISYQPEPYAYFNDQLSFLRVAYLVEGGLDYYSANEKAITEDGRIFTVPEQVWGWRMPTYSYIWAILPGNVGISSYLLFIGFATISLLMVHKIGGYFSEYAAVIAPYLVFPYFHFAARDIAFLELEWWGLTFYVFGILFIFKKKFLYAILSLALALCVREIYSIPIFAALLTSVYFHKIKAASTILVALTIFFFFWLLHFYFVGKHLGINLDILEPRDHPLGLFFLMQTLSYASWDYVLFHIRPFSIIFALQILALIYLKLKNKITFRILLVSMPALAMAFATLKIGTPPYDDYWGISFVPLIIISLPMMIFYKRPTNDR